ncbi:MAG: sulfate ABC transporter permease subunit CysW [Synergistaceae bacterium]|nr:sulfate ABC transporter permease subunit CysW [Synergistaceae bacterium]
MALKNEDGSITRALLITASLLFLFIMLILPLCIVLYIALRSGWETYKNTVTDFYTLKALQLTLSSTLVAVVVNTLFGLFAAWAITKFSFRGKKFLTTMIDVPFAISPVIAGLIFILTFGRIGWAHEWLDSYNINIVFAVPGIILAVIFVTFPFVARELIPVLNAQGSDEEEAAALMGANGFVIFFRVTLPNIKWALLYGVILCTARAMGEFGAVSVLSGHLRGKTNTLPLHVEILYNEYKYSQAFAVSSILVIMAVIILIARNIVEYKGKKELGL